MRRYLTGLAIILACVSLAGADGDFRNGYYWFHGRPYKLSYRTVPCAYGHCRREAYYEAVPYTAPAADHTVDYDWRKELESLKRSQMRSKLLALKFQAEQKEFDEAIQSLGLQGSPAYSLYGTTYSRTTPLAQQGTTVYQPLTQATQRPEIDLMRLYNEAAQLSKGLQQLGGQATGDFQSLVAQQATAQDQQAARDAEIAKILARAQAAQQLLQMLDGPAQQTESESSLLITPHAQGTPEAPAPDSTGRTLEQVIQQRCLACHGPADPKGGFDMSGYFTADADTVARVIDRITTDDESKLMPRTKDGKAAPLGLEEYTLFLDDMQRRFPGN